MITRSQRYYDKEKGADQLERYKMLVDAIEDYAIFLLDQEGYVISWNLGAEKLKGYKPKDIIGHHFSDFYTEEDKRNNKPSIELEYSKAHGRIEDEGWRVRKDGTQFWANVIITALFDKKGTHKGFAKITRDLTERKKYEDKLYNSNIKLAASFKELQKLNVIKDEFVSLASHQLRTPATGVKQYLSLLIDGFMGPLTERQMDALLKAFKSNDRQIEIVNDLLEVAQLDAGKIELNKTSTDVVSLIEDVVDEQVDIFKNRRQKVTLDMPRKSLSVNLDPVRFRMVIENLIDNASKYTLQKGEIVISADQEGKFCKISVKDTGIGIKKEDISKLFEKFTRLSDSHTKNINGSGLGLYWVDKIVKLHKGTISVDSTPGEGTTFNILMPIGVRHG